MKDIIRKKLDEMEDLEQRNVLKKIVGGVFEELVDYQDQANERLEDRVFNEVEDREENYSIYNTIIKKDRAELVDDFLYPLVENDVEEKTYDQQEIVSSLQAGEEVAVTQVFLKVKTKLIRQLREGDRVFSGTIISEDGQCSITLELRYKDDYIQEEKKLYQTFLDNSIKWRTINNPYIRKFFDIVIVDCEDNINQLSGFEEINFNLEGFDEHKYVNYIPVWNIEKVYNKGDGFPLAAEDKINYDHTVSLKELGTENGYLVVSGDYNILAVKRGVEKLVITSDESNSVAWELLKIVQEERFWEEEFEFDLLSNTKQDSFMNKFVQQQGRNIRTKGELRRIINSFKEIDGFTLAEVEVIDRKVAFEMTYNFNSFIEDQIRVDNFREVLLLTFDSEINSYLEYDLLSFLVSEIQMYFPEYICKGVIA